jgi:hypothetical protein
LSTLPHGSAIGREDSNSIVDEANEIDEDDSHDGCLYRDTVIIHRDRSSQTAKEEEEEKTARSKAKQEICAHWDSSTFLVVGVVNGEKKALKEGT